MSITTPTQDTMNEPAPAAGRSLVKAPRRSFRRAALALAFLADGTVATASAADASVNTGPNSAPSHLYSLTGTTCTALVGAVKTSTGAAEGGVDVSCRNVYKLTATVVLYRWNGSTWQTWSSGPWTATSSALSVHTAAVCGGGAAQWLERAYVTVGNANYGPLESNSVTSPYTPPNC